MFSLSIFSQSPPRLRAAAGLTPHAPVTVSMVRREMAGEVPPAGSYASPVVTPEVRPSATG